MAKNTDWSWTYIFFKKIDFYTGQALDRSNPVMTRKVNGVRQYRKMTPEEEQTYESQTAW